MLHLIWTARCILGSWASRKLKCWYCEWKEVVSHQRRQSGFVFILWVNRQTWPGCWEIKRWHLPGDDLVRRESFLCRPLKLWRWQDWGDLCVLSYAAEPFIWLQVSLSAVLQSAWEEETFHGGLLVVWLIRRCWGQKAFRQRAQCDDWVDQRWDYWD